MAHCRIMGGNEAQDFDLKFEITDWTYSVKLTLELREQ